MRQCHSNITAPACTNEHHFDQHSLHISISSAHVFHCPHLCANTTHTQTHTVATPPLLPTRRCCVRSVDSIYWTFLPMRLQTRCATRLAVQRRAPPLSAISSCTCGPQRAVSSLTPPRLQLQPQTTLQQTTSLHLPSLWWQSVACGLSCLPRCHALSSTSAR